MPERSAVGRRATSVDVARLAGVSRSTVSEIFNGRGSRFPPETLDRVRDAASRLRYSPSQAARSLKTGRSNSILLVIPNLAAAGEFTGLLDGISGVIGEEGLHLMIQFAPDKSASLVDEILRLHPAGVIDLGVMTTDAQQILRSSGVLVVPDAADPSNSDFQRSIGRLLMTTLLNNSERQYFYAGSVGLSSHDYDNPRLLGMREIAAERGAPLPSAVDLPLNAEGAARVIESLMRSGPIGIGCYTDTVAMAAVAGARHLGLRVPTDVAVVGVDGSTEGQLTSPRLTSVEVNGRLVGSAVATALVVELAGTPRTISLDMSEALHVLAGESA